MAVSESCEWAVSALGGRHLCHKHADTNSQEISNKLIRIRLIPRQGGYKESREDQRCGPRSLFFLNSSRHPAILVVGEIKLIGVI